MRRPRLAIASVLLGLAVATPAAPAAQEQPAGSAVPGTPPTVFSNDRVIVVWATDASHADRVEARSDAEVGFDRDLGNRGFQLVEVEPGQTAGDAIRELREDPAVAVAERDSYSAPDAIPDDPLFGELWGLRNLGLGVAGFSGAAAGADIDAVGAWNRTVGTPATVIADIDSGYRFEHPDLVNVAWTNPGEIAENGVDDDGNGVKDDVHGADFVGPNGESPTTDGNPTDEDLLSGGHGVHTAGTMGAQGNNGIGITGVAQDVRIMPLRVCSRFPALADSRCPTSSQIAAINYAAAKGARVANMSLGGTSSSQAEVNAIAAAKEVLFVISAGNDSQNNDSVHHYPCDYTPQTQASPPVSGAVDNIVCVAATNQADGLASFSDWGATSVDLGAPGTETLSTFPVRRFVEETFEADDFGSKWTATGPDGGFARSSEAPLTSFGMTDSPGEAPVAGTTRESTSTAVAVPAGFSRCTLYQSRTVSLGGGTYTYEVLLDGSTVGSASPSTSGRFSLSLNNVLQAGGNLALRFRYTAGGSPSSSNGVWVDDIELECVEPVGQATGYEFLQGTSMAAPHVTGAAALLFSFKPSATVSEVKNALLSSVDPVPSLQGKTVSDGRLNISQAIAAFEEEPVDHVPPAPPALTSTVPASPADENHPLILGSAEAGSIVRLYEGTACAGMPVTGTAAELESPGIAVTVPDDSTTEFSATATDVALNTSTCSAPIAYTESTPSEPVAEEPPNAAEEERKIEEASPPAIPQPPAIPLCTVPKLAGMTLRQATAALTKATCRLGTVTRLRTRGGTRRASIVKFSRPGPGAKPASRTVALTLVPKPKPKKHQQPR